MRAGQELRREVGHHLDARVQHGVDRLQVAIEQAVANGQRERHVPVVAGRVPGRDPLLVMQVVGNRGGDRLLPEAGPHRGTGGSRSEYGRGVVDASRLHAHLTYVTHGLRSRMPLPLSILLDETALAIDFLSLYASSRRVGAPPGAARAACTEWPRARVARC